MKKTYGILILSAFLALLLAFLMPGDHGTVDAKSLSEKALKEAVIPQKVTKINNDEKEVSVIYYKDQAVGVLKDRSKLDNLLTKIYHDKYKREFPDSRLGLGEDVHITKTLSLFQYEDKDQEILAYLKKHDLFSIEVNKITFSNGEECYVKNVDDFTKASEAFVKTFIPKKDYQLIKNGQGTEALTTYGNRYVSFQILEGATLSKGLASQSRILKNQKDILMYLSYGYDHQEVYYTTQEFDTVAGIAWLNRLEPKQLMAINSDLLKSKDQVIQAGLKLNVTKITPPISVEVVKQEMVEETIAPENTKTIYDETLREGKEVVVQKAEEGSRDVTYEITYINGEQTASKEVAQKITKSPVQEIIRIGTKVEPKIGSGHFGWPVRNPRVTCPMYCYSGHLGTDIQNYTDLYGDVLASDRGVVVTNSYTSINGNYMVINHNNGYETYYGHMSRPGFFQPGETVAKGEVIGPIGMTGFATGPHVHFEIRQNGQRLNALDYIGK